MKSLIYILVTCGFLLVPFCTPASGIVFMPRAGLGYENYEAVLFDAFGDEVIIAPSYRRVDAGLTASRGGLYLDAAVAAGWDVDVDDSFGNTARFRRDEWAVSTGYRWGERFSAFAGYRAASARIEYGGSFTENIDFETRGPFVGAAYSQLLGFGSIRLSAVYAWRSAAIDSDRLVAGDVQPQSDGAGRFIELVFLKSLSDRLGLYIGTGFQSYEYDGWNDFSGNPVPVVTPEKSATFSIGGSVVF